MRLTRRALALRYAAFAGIAVLSNLLVQRAVLLGDETPGRLVAAMAAGTLAGLGVKFWLDKHYIFFDTGRGLRRNTGKFLLYAVTGVLTTAIFWLAEGGFWWIWRSDAMRELGALLGLAAGYTIKYRLDRRFVFEARP